MKTLIFIDGENLRHKLAEVLKAHKRIKHGQDLKKFDLRGLVQELLPENRDITIRYYGARVKLLGKQKATRQKSLAIIQQKRAWNSALKQQSIEYVEAGTLRLRSDGYPRNTEYFVEKGVDVSIAVEMVVSVLKHKAIDIVLLSSDADLLPAVQILKAE